MRETRGTSARSGSGMWSRVWRLGVMGVRMALRVCNVPGCPRLQPETRCTEHRRETDRKRGSSTARGYDYRHQKQRAAWAPRVATGTVRCRRCLKPIQPGAGWDLGHPDADCPRPIAPEHAACNRAVSGR